MITNQDTYKDRKYTVFQLSFEGIGKDLSFPWVMKTGCVLEDIDLNRRHGGIIINRDQ